MRMDEKWIRDTGLVFSLLFLVLGFNGNQYFLGASVFFLACLLFAQKVLTPVAWVWLKLTHILAFVMNRVFFGLVFFVIVVPIGMIRRLIRGDERDLRSHPERESAFLEREVVVVARDLVNPF